MPLPKRYHPDTAEPHLAQCWLAEGLYDFSPQSTDPIFSIDTPPPTVSGFLHLGHVYSYSHPDFIARFQRMNGCNVFYPMGYDDNGLPTERLVERRYGTRAEEVGRVAFIEKCLQVSQEIEHEYQAVWQRLGLSIDWRYTYSTIDERSRRASQQSFLDLYEQGLVYRREAPTIWCPECHSAIAQAEVNDLERESEFVTISFGLQDGGTLSLATTRPELLPACVAVFVHPEDPRYRHLVGRQVTVPLFGQKVPLLEDPGASPDKGTGAVMCCTFGDTADVEWWYKHHLPLKVAISRDGRLTDLAGEFAGMTVNDARRAIVDVLGARGLISGRQRITQSVRVHERDDTPVEYIVTRQWFVRVLDAKEQFLRIGDRIQWHPAHMKARYREWVENLGWDWCISRQRYYGVTFPVWYCDACGEVVPADPAQLPVDPAATQPKRACSCGGAGFTPEQDVMDTWATSSLSPQIAAGWLTDPQLYDRIFPLSLRAQSHEIIRTWAFYTIVKSHYQFGSIPWGTVLISGWGLAPEGVGKISKSRGGGPMAPMEMIERYSADAARYWAASTWPGKDAIISEEKIAAGTKLVTKLWNVAGFSGRFLEEYHPPPERPVLSPADRWILSGLQLLVRQTTDAFQAYDYASAKNETEGFFWRDFADNYLEMSKKRLYDADNERREGARYTLYRVLLTTLKLLAPIMPFVTDSVYRGQFAVTEDCVSIHRSWWPVVDEELIDDRGPAVGDVLVEIATAVRRYKSDRNLSLGSEVERLQVVVERDDIAAALAGAEDDISSVTRARHVQLVKDLDPHLDVIKGDGGVRIALSRQYDG